MSCVDNAFLFLDFWAFCRIKGFHFWSRDFSLLNEQSHDSTHIRTAAKMAERNGPGKQVVGEFPSISPLKPATVAGQKCYVSYVFQGVFRIKLDVSVVAFGAERSTHSTLKGGGTGTIPRVFSNGRPYWRLPIFVVGAWVLLLGV